ncbi:hypothetical protein IKQ21_04310 [bacterium]|nr:hypothetical protein [bacterium]
MKKYRNYIILFLIILCVLVTICFIPINASKLVPVVEKQVAEELGVKIHIEELIFRLGPSLKIKAPTMHMMYEDGQKFGQFDNVRIIIPWTALFKDDFKAKKLYANNLILKINSNDKYLKDIIEKISAKDFKENPDIYLKNYSFSYKDCDDNNLYKTDGENFALTKLTKFSNYKVNAQGNFYINNEKYISYDVSILPNIDIPDAKKSKFDYKYFTEQIVNLDFNSDIIADLKLYKNINDELQISGLVNVDNISVLDKEKKNPKSFIYLTFFGNKAGILSNIYSTGDKKVCIEGTLNNSKKPDIDLKIKTDEINLSDLYKKIKLIADFSGLKSIDSVNGNLIADFSLKGDLKKIRSSGYLKISDSSIKASGVNINNISADVDLSNNTISIANAEGYVNGAPIMLRGKIDNKLDLELLMNKVDLRSMLPKTFGVESGIVSLAANISGTFENIIHKENLQIDNFRMKKDKYAINFANLKFDTNKENIAYVNNLIVKPEFSEFIKFPQLKLYITNDAIKIPDTNIFMPNSKCVMKADVTGYNTNDAVFNVNIDGFINSKDVDLLKSNPAIYPLKIKVNGNNSIQNIESQVLLEKANLLDEPAIINLVSKLEDNTLKIDDFSVLNFSGVFSNNFKSNLKGQKKIIVSGNIDNIKEPVFKNLRVFIPQQLNLSLKDTIAQLKGDVFINGPYKQPEIVGQISVQNLINQFLQLSVNNLTIDFNKNIALINAPIVKLADSSFALTSSVLTDVSKEFVIKNLNIKSKYANTDTLLMYKDSPLMKVCPFKINEGKFYAERANITLYGSPLYISALTTDFSVINNVLITKNTSAELYNGKMCGALEFNLQDEGFKSKIQARGVSASPIFDVIAIKKDTVSGTMDFDTNISGNIINKQSLNGDVKFIVHNGRMGTLGKLEHLLYAQNVVADNMLRTSLSVVTKAITLKDTGLFKFLRGDISIHNGIADVNMLQSQGPLMALYIKGQYNPATDYAKLIVLGRLSDEVVSGLGAFADFSFNKLMIMLTGEENNKYNIKTEDMEKLPQLPMRNTKEFRSVIMGTLEKPSSVLQFNWISYSQKSLRQKEVPMGNVKLPDFVESLPY